MKFHQLLDYSEKYAGFKDYYRIVQTNVITSYLWYRRNKNSARILFRTSGTFVIVFSIAIPVITTSAHPEKDLIITIMALAIAIFTGLNTFYKWGEKWQSFIRSELAIAQLISLWKLEVIKAEKLQDETEQLNLLDKATKQLVDEVGIIISQETEDYFSKVEWPKKKS